MVEVCTVVHPEKLMGHTGMFPLTIFWIPSEFVGGSTDGTTRLQKAKITQYNSTMIGQLK